MSTKSHVDLCMFVQILEVSEDKIPDSLKDKLLSRKYAEIASAIEANGDTTNIRWRFVNDETNLHESIHLIQGVIYPYMRLYSIYAFIQITRLFKMIPDIVLMDENGDILSATVAELAILDLDFYVADLSRKILFWKFDQHVLGLSAKPSDFKADQILTKLNVIDLLENAASLIQYKISSSKDFPSWNEFKRWSKRNPSYTGVIDFAAKYLEDNELAIRIFLPIVQVSFETSWPVRTFITLLGALKFNYKKGFLNEFISQPEPCRWIELFDSYMDKIKFDDADMGDFATNKYFRLDRYATSNIRVGGKLGHPIIGKFAKIWGDLERDDIAYRYAFTAPNGYSEQIMKINGLFTSPISILKFNIRQENIVLVVGDPADSGFAGWMDYAYEAGLVDDPQKNLKSALVDYFLMYGAARRFTSSLMDRDFRLCHHSECPYYAANYCNTWVLIPARYEECKFIEHFKYMSEVANHRSSSESLFSIEGDS